MPSTDTVLTLLESPEVKNTALRAALEEVNEVDIAEVFNDVDSATLVRLFRLLSKDTQADVFSYLNAENQAHLLTALADREVADIVNGMFADDATDLAREMPSNVVTRILSLASAETRKDINMLLQYPEGSAGSLMTTEFVTLKVDMTVEEAFARIRKTGLHKETIYTCYVMNDSRVLEGVVSVRQLLLATPETAMRDIMSVHPISVTTTTDVEEVAMRIRKYDFMSLPVVDSEGRIVGIVTTDDIIGVIRRANTEDIERMAAIAPSGDTPYLKTGVLRLTSRRILWLFVLMVSGLFTGMIIGAFQDKLRALPLLIWSVPMLMDGGGNAGCQASTLVIRGLALGEVSPKDSGRILIKEFLVGLMCGACMVPIALLKVLLIDRGTALAGLTVGLSMAVAMTVAKVIGSQLPLLAKICRLDPAVMTAPLITTISDTCSISVYFLLATLLLGI
jgi:magnesium transporter